MKNSRRMAFDVVASLMILEFAFLAPSSAQTKKPNILSVMGDDVSWFNHFMLGTNFSDVPVFKITQEDSSIKFSVKASVALEGTFDKWDATFTVTSTDAETGVLDVKIQADSVNTGSGMKDGKLKSKDFFDVKQDPFITFHSTKIVQTGPDTFDVQGTFTIRGVSKPETLNLTLSGKGTGSGEVKGTMAFDRKDFGMNSGIPFIKIADRVEVTVDLKAKRVSGPPLVFKAIAGPTKSRSQPGAVNF